MKQFRPLSTTHVKAAESPLVYRGDAIWLIYEDDAFLAANCQRFEMATRKRVAELVHEHDRLGFARFLSEAFAQQNGGCAAAQFRLPTESRDWRWVEGRAWKHQDPSGIDCVLLNLRDISREKRLEEDLLRATTLLERAEEIGRMGAWQSGHPDPELLWSKCTHEIFGIPEGTPVNKDLFFSLVHPEEREMVLDAVNRTMEGFGPYSIEHRIVLPDGSLRWIHERGDWVKDFSSGENIMVGVCQDITDRKEMDRQRTQAERLEALGRLAGGVAHDFNNYLMAILGYCHIALQSLEKPGKCKQHLEQIKQATESAAQLTRQLLALGRQQVLNPRAIDLSQNLRRLEPMLRQLLPENIDLEVLSAATTSTVLADPGQVERVVLNLTLNARDAMPKGGTIRLLITESRIDENEPLRSAGLVPGHYVILSVSDEGHGIPAADLDHIFEPFFTTKIEGEGTGLGLSTVFGIVKQSGGHVEATSTEGHGATFRVYLPLIETSSSHTV